MGSPFRALCLSLARLKQLEQEVVGGEQARNEELQQRHSQRKKLADQRKEHLIRALAEDGEESDNVLLDVYNSIQEEVYAKGQMLLKVQGKVGIEKSRTFVLFFFFVRKVKHTVLKVILCDITKGTGTPPMMMPLPG